ncbi:hypothetical protein U1Q18_046949 [Sarracenia purpurea var. burkii]
MKISKKLTSMPWYCLCLAFLVAYYSDALAKKWILVSLRGSPYWTNFFRNNVSYSNAGEGGSLAK